MLGQKGLLLLFLQGFSGVFGNLEQGPQQQVVAEESSTQSLNISRKILSKDLKFLEAYIFIRRSPYTPECTSVEICLSLKLSLTQTKTSLWCGLSVECGVQWVLN